MQKKNEIIQNLIKTSKRQNMKFPKPDRVIDTIYSNKYTYLQKVELLDAYKIYSDYCDPRDIEFTFDQEIEIMEGIILGIDYGVYLNKELSPNIMKRTKELLVMGVDVRKTLGKDLVMPEDSLHILDITIRVKKGEDVL